MIAHHLFFFSSAAACLVAPERATGDIARVYAGRRQVEHVTGVGIGDAGGRPGRALLNDVAGLDHRAGHFHLDPVGDDAEVRQRLAGSLITVTHADRFQGVRAAVNADQEDMALSATFHQLTNLIQRRSNDLGADAIGVHIDGIQFGAGGHIQRRLAEVLGAPLGGATDDFDILVVGEVIVKAAAAQLRHVLAQIALQFEYRAPRFAIALSQQFHQAFGSLLPGHIVVGLHGHVDFAAQGRAVNGVEGDARVLRPLYRGADRLAVHRHNHNRVHALRDKIVDLVGLGFGVEISVGADDFPALGLRRVDQAAHDHALTAAQFWRAITNGDSALRRHGKSQKHRQAHE